MTNRMMLPGMTPIMINYADNAEWRRTASRSDKGGVGFEIAKQIDEHAAKGCNKISYSCLVPGLFVVHGPKGYLKIMREVYGEYLRPVKANRLVLEEAILTNASRFEMTIDTRYLDFEITMMLAPKSSNCVFEVGCTPSLRPGLYNEFRDRAA